MIELKLPEIGENIDHAEVSRVLVSEGDRVQVDQNVLELESEKASFPLPSTHAGKVAKIRVKVGDSVSVGQTLLDIEETQEAEATDKPGKKGPAASAVSAKPPQRDQSKAKAEKADTAPAKASRQKASSTPNGREPAGKSAEAEEAAEMTHAAQARNREQEQQQSVGTTAEHAFVAAGPATRTLARELGVSLEQVEGHGPGGRITREDVKAFVQRRLQDGSSDEDKSDAGLSARDQPGPGVPPLPDFEQWGPVSRQRLGPLARTAAERLSLAWRIVPHVTQHDFADITELEAARKHYNDLVSRERERPESRPKLTATALAIRAVVAALKKFPRCNSSLDMSSGELILKNYCHIGVAVDTEKGLLVPVLRDANRKSLVELAAEVAQLAEKARAGSLTKKDMEGGTFTISNLGGIGGTSFTPIVNYPEVAILGISRADWRIVASSPHSPLPEGEGNGVRVERRLLLPLSLSYDHRVINGADGARFLVLVAQLLSDPFQLLAES